MKNQMDQAIADLTEAIRLDPQDASAHTDRGAAWLQLNEIDKAIADFDRGHPPRPEGRGRLRQSRRRPWPGSTSRTRPSPTSTRPSGSIPPTPWPSTTAAGPGSSRGNTTRRSPTTTRRSGSIPAWPWPTPIAASCWRGRTETDQALADCNKAIRLDPRNAAGLRQPRRRLAATQRAGQGPGRPGRGDPARPRHGRGLRQPRGRLGRGRTSPTRPSPTWTRPSGSTRRDATAYTNRGWAWMMKDELDKAIADLDEAIRLDPKDAMAYTNRGAAWLKKDELDKAIADLDEAIRLDPKHAMAYQQPRRRLADEAAARQGHRRLRRGDPARSPECPGAQESRVRPGCTARSIDKAIADFDEAIRLDPRDADRLRRPGRSLALPRGVRQGHRRLRRGHPARPAPGEAYANRGIVWARRKEYDKAIADLNEAIRLDPDDVRPYADRGAAWGSKGQLDKALADLTEAIRLDPENDSAYADRANVWFERREFDKALADLDDGSSASIPRTRWSTTLAPASGSTRRTTTRPSPTWTRRSGSSPERPATASIAPGPGVEKGRYDEALADLDEAIRLDPRNAPGYNGRAWLRATCPEAKYRDGKQAVESATQRPLSHL